MLLSLRDCLVPVTPYLAGIFKLLLNKSKLQPNVSNKYARHTSDPAIFPGRTPH